ncbi:MAG: alpha-glucan family phosphorylase, partial [Dehalococcoidia bacterium]|nr:alpha-glucan family phosphorylase [Dehalococcoidia bacterium]
GVHVPTWIAPEMRSLLETYLGPNWVERQDDPRIWERVMDIPDEEIWKVHLLLKQKLKAATLDWARQSWTECRVSPRQVVTMGSLLDAEALTIAFVRRFAEYKRPALIFHDLPRLKRLVGNRFRPLQVVFAGKSHPADFPSKYLLHQVYTLANSTEFGGRIAFIEDYDMHMARYLVQGVDVWLNVPRRLNEACGTSGMKAALNGAPHLSVRDGWWHEGYNGRNGWAIGDGRAPATSEEEDRADAEALYDLLENQVVPLYYDRDRKGVPHGWIQVVKEAICSVAPGFSARRMLKEYLTGYYLKAAGAGQQPAG